MLEEFVLYPWGRLDPKNADDYAVLQDIKDCGFNTSPFLLPDQFAAARKAGLRPYAMCNELSPWENPDNYASNYNLSDEEAVARIKACLEKLPDDAEAFYIKDEPGAKLYPRLKLLCDTVKQYRPGVEPYINLLPNYAVCDSPNSIDSQTETATYEEYLERFATEVNACFISLDNYLVLISGEGENRELFNNYFLNLIQAQNVCQKHHIPFQHVVCCCQLRSYQVAPTYNSFALQAFSSLAAGAKAIGWFMYFDTEYLYSPIRTENGIDTRSESWYLLRDINRRILPLGQLLFHMTFEEMYFKRFAEIEGAHNPKEISDFDGFTFNGDYMIGQFNDHGKKVYMLVNVSCQKPLSITVDDDDKWRIYDGNYKTFHKLMKTPEGEVPSPLWIAPGCGEVITMA